MKKLNSIFLILFIIFNIFLITHVVFADTLSGLSGYWKFNENSGSLANDSSVNILNGTIVGSPAWVTGKINSALSFDGTNAKYVSIGRPASIANMSAFTLAAWANPTAAPASLQPIVEIGSGSSIWKTLTFLPASGANPGQVEALVRYSGNLAKSVSVANTYTLGTWDHWAVTFDDSTDKIPHIYKNGVEVTYSSQLAGSGTISADSSYSWVIGATPGTSFSKFNGIIDDVHIYNRALSSGEISTLASDLSETSPVVVPPPDTTLPQVTITSPGSGSTVSGTVTISADATDNAAVSGVQFLVDGVNAGAEITSAPYSYSWSSASVSDGTHTISAVVRDSSGNTATTSVSVFVFNTVYTAPPSSGTSDAVGTPFIYYSDLTSGPKSGNTDISRGQISGQDGVIVTVWGKNLGTIQGNSKVYVNGAEARVYTWGNATSPADMSTMHRMQMVAFQVSHNATDGAGTIYMTINGKQTNTLPFTVRAGNIYFVDVNGNDTNTGTFTSPWKTILRCVHTQKTGPSILPGDTCYIRDGVTQTTLDNAAAYVNLDTNGTADAPKAVVGYPGATVNVGGDVQMRGFGQWGGTNNAAQYWTLSKMNIRAMTAPVNMFTGWRVVGNKITAPLGDGPTGGVIGTGNDLYFLGNEVTNVGKYGATKLYHPIYISGARVTSGARLPTESNREIAWNYIHDNYAFRGINIYSEGASSAYIANHYVHDNVVMNQTGDGILIGQMMIGDIKVYNNLLVRTAQGPNPPGDSAGYFGMEVAAGHSTYSSPVDVYIYNNTFYGNGFAGALNAINTQGNLLFSYMSQYTLHFSNNIIYSIGEPFLAGWSAKPASGAYRNLWYGQTTPTWDTAAISADPKFVNVASNDFRLNSNSPAIDVGVDSTSFVPRDLDSISRPQGNGVDIGAYEYDNGSSLPPPDTTAPTVSLLSSTGITSTSATITWSTSELSDGVVEYGLTTAYGAVSTPDLSLVTTHSISLSGLIPGTVYHYRIKTKDSASNQTVSTDSTFTTAANVVQATPAAGNTGGGSTGSSGGGTTSGGGGGSSPSTGSGNTGGGGGGGVTSGIAQGSTGTVANPISGVDTTSLTSTTASSNSISVPQFTRTLSIGLKGSDITELQKYLVKKGYLPTNLEYSDYFGPLTRGAVQKMQCDLGVVCNGDEASTGYGILGQKTRQALGVSSETTTQTTTQQTNTNTQPSSTTLLTRTLSFGMKGDDVTILQKYLISKGYLPDTLVPTAYFGQLTRGAVQKFQCDLGIVCGGDEGSTGYGLVGKITRGRIGN